MTKICPYCHTEFERDEMLQHLRQYCRFGSEAQTTPINSNMFGVLREMACQIWRLEEFARGFR